jgi:hypothetical protein
MLYLIKCSVYYDNEICEPMCQLQVLKTGLFSKVKQRDREIERSTR